MTDAIVVAGGDNVRRSRFTSKLGTEGYKIRICRSLEDFGQAVLEDRINAILLLYPDQARLIDNLFASGVIAQFFGKIPLVLISSSPAENNLARSMGYKADEFLIEPVSQLEIANLIDTSLSSKAKKASWIF